MENNNELLKGVTLSIVQRALAGFFAMLIGNGWINHDQATGLTLIIAGIVGTALTWLHAYFKTKAKLRFQDTAIEIAKVSSSSTPTSLIKSEAKKELSGVEPTK